MPRSPREAHSTFVYATHRSCARARTIANTTATAFACDTNVCPYDRSMVRASRVRLHATHLVTATRKGPTMTVPQTTIENAIRATRSDRASSRSLTQSHGALPVAIGIVLASLGAVLLCGGAWLVARGGSSYYAVAGAARDRNWLLARAPSCGRAVRVRVHARSDYDLVDRRGRVRLVATRAATRRLGRRRARAAPAVGANRLVAPSNRQRRLPSLPRRRCRSSCSAFRWRRTITIGPAR